MKKNSILFIFFALLFSLNVPFFSSEAEDSVPASFRLSEYLSENGIKSKSQDIISSENNGFPFNLSVSFKPDLSSAQKTGFINDDQRTNLIIAFCAEDALNHRILIRDFLQQLSMLSLKNRITVLFTSCDYPEKYPFPVETGTASFINLLTDKDKYCAVTVNLSEKETGIIPGGSGNAAPAWLTTLCAESFYRSDLSFNISGGLLSALYRMNVLKSDIRTNLFLEDEIPCCTVNFASGTDSESILKVLESISGSFDSSSASEWDRHTNFIPSGKKLYKTTERFSILNFLIISFAALSILCEFSFLIKKSGINVSRDVIKLWYIIPLTGIITGLGFYISQFFSYFLTEKLYIDLFSQIGIKIFTAFLLTTLFFVLIIRFQGILHSNAYAYLLTLSGIVNIFIFNSIDVSLFYIFIIEYLIIYASRLVKSTVSLSVFFALLLIPFIPYIIQIVKYTDPERTGSLIKCSLPLNIALAFAFVPFEILWFRILTGIAESWKKSDEKKRKFFRQNFIIFGSSVFIFLVLLLVISAVLPSEYKSERLLKTVFKESDEKALINLSQNTYFGETSAVLEISLKEKADAVFVKISGEKNIPVLYSDEEYISRSAENSIVFKTTLNPPEKLTYRFIADTDTDSEIEVSAFRKDRDFSKNHIIFCSKTVMNVSESKEKTDE